jgi:hypothetical protein
LTCSFSNSVLTVQNAIGSAVSALVEVAFYVSGFRNPISTDTITGFTITTYD